MRAIPDAAVEIVARFEGCELTGYLCPAGVPTIGYGHTGPEVKVGQKINQSTARALLKDDLKAAAARIAARLKPGILGELTDNQYAALLSFVFNLGADPKWTIWKVLNAGSFDQAPPQFMRFVYAGGKKLNGLVRRRTAEVELWSTDEPGAVDEDLPSTTTREIETPPAPMGKPPAASKSLVATAATAAAAAPVAIAQVSQVVEPYADKSPAIANMVATLATLAALAAVAALVFTWIKNRNMRR
ncbi:MAG: lysozyme [Pseudomonadota bacterium]